MKCQCTKLPDAFYLDEGPHKFADSLTREDLCAWLWLGVCPKCGAMWSVDEWDKYQEKVVIRVYSREEWNGTDTTDLRKQLLLNSRGGKALGISGVDGSLLVGKVKRKEMGYVGTVTSVNTAVLNTLIKAGFIPVIAPLSIYSPGGSDGEPQILNVNGDTVAGEVAAAIAAERLIFLTDVDGIHDEQDNLIPHLSPAEAEGLLSSEIASGGMIPKLRACLKALTRSSTASIIGGKNPHALLREIEGEEIGTTIRADIG